MKGLGDTCQMEYLIDSFDRFFKDALSLTIPSNHFDGKALQPPQIA